MVGSVFEALDVCWISHAWVFTNDSVLLFLSPSNTKCSIWNSIAQCPRHLSAQEEVEEERVLPCGHLCDGWRLDHRVQSLGCSFCETAEPTWHPRVLFGLSEFPPGYNHGHGRRL